MTATKLDSRQSDLAQIHMGKKALGWSEDEYRDILRTVCQVSSSGQLDHTGRKRFIEHLAKCGWKAGSPKPGAKAFPKLTKTQGKVYSLWQQIYEAKGLQDRSYKAMEAWIEGQTGVVKLVWLNPAQLDQVTESLKKWLARVKR